MTYEEIEAILADWLQSMERRDAASLAARFSEDAIYTSMVAGTIRGRPAIEAMYRGWFTAFPEMVFEVESRLIDGARAAVLWSQQGRHLGEFVGIPATDRSFVLPGVFFMTFMEGKIVSLRSIYDFTGLLIQVGVLKAKPAL
ncbi:MAG: ester cyclase [Acidobacteriota bacterium]|jgi:steroid delta-isomerase-like uncharacterized protein